MNSLVPFEAAARLLSFTRAGEEPLISREAVSRHIRMLESHLETKLFDRLYRSLELTKAGKQLQAAVQDGLENIARSAAALRRLRQPSKVSVTATIAITSFWLTPRLPKFREKQPEAEIRINVSDTHIDLVGEDIDIGLWYGDGNWPGLDATHLFDVDSYPVCSPEYLDNSTPITGPNDLVGETLLNLDGAQHSFEDWAWWLGNFDLQMPTTVQAIGFDSYANIIQAALDGQGIALGFSHIIDGVLSKGLLVRPIEHTLSKGLAVYVVVPSGVSLSPSAQKFVDWVLAEAGLSAQ